MRLSIFLFILLISTAVYPQSTAVRFSSAVSPSPNAAEFAKYGEIPVSTYTGIPDINIPLFTVNDNLPIKLDYHAGGFKASDEASWVGLGWSLQAGGVITRAKKHMDDLASNGFFRKASHTNGDGYDKEPDMFYFNFLDFKGRFIIVHSYNSVGYEIKFISFKDDGYLKVELVNDQTWKITDVKGVIYEFKDMESQNDRTTVSGRFGGDAWTYDYTSSWYLSSIKYPNGRLIEFKYVTGPTIEPVPQINQVLKDASGKQTLIPYSCYIPTVYDDLSTTTVNTKIYTKILSEIKFDAGKIEFITSERDDLRSSSSAPQKLSTIKIYSKYGTAVSLIKQLTFKYNYFDSESGRDNYLSKRLRLTGISEIGPGTPKPKDHTFFYSPYKLPDKDTKDIDHWGYSNGVKNNTGYVHRDRTPDPLYGKACVIENITYPTQGKTTFEFELNDFSNMGLNLSWAPNNSDNTGVIGAGVRVRKIFNWNENNALVKSISYEYKKDVGGNILSSGRLMTPIQYYHGYEQLEYFQGQYGTPCYAYQNYQIRELGYIYYGNSAIPNTGNAQGMEVGYDQVTIKESNAAGEVHTTVEEYNNVDLLPPPSSYPTIPFKNNNTNGLLKFRTLYANQSGVERPVKQYEYFYDTKSSSTVTAYVFVREIMGSSNGLAGYPIVCEWIVNSKIIERDIDPANASSFISKVTEKFYDPATKQKIKETNTDSKGQELATIFRYADYKVANGITVPYQEMVDKNMIGLEVEQEFQVNGVKQNRAITDYSKGWTNTSHILPSLQQYQYKNDSPEIRVQYNQYDYFGNPIEVSPVTSSKVSYKWGYNNKQFPVAEIKNAAVNEFYSENFEDKTVEFDNGATLDSARVHTGRYSLKISNAGPGEKVSHQTAPLLITLNAKRRFTFSGWVYSDGPSAQLFLFMKRSGESGYYSYIDDNLNTTTNKWVYMTKDFEVPADVTTIFLRLDNNDAGNVWYDDLRIQPSEASMTTFTFVPLVGMTSSIDDKGHTTFYEYDFFQRLKSIKDTDGNIVKAYDYHHLPYVP